MTSAGISTSFIGLAVMVVIEQKAKGRLKVCSELCFLRIG